MYLYWNSKVYLSRLSKLMYLSSNSEVYLKQTFNIDVFIFKLRSILEVDFLNLSIYVQTQKKILEVYFVSKKVKKYLNEVLLKHKHRTFLFSSVFILHLYFLLGTSLKAYFYLTSRIWSINEVYLKYASYIVFFSVRDPPFAAFSMICTICK